MDAPVRRELVRTMPVASEIEDTFEQAFWETPMHAARNLKMHSGILELRSQAR